MQPRLPCWLLVEPGPSHEVHAVIWLPVNGHFAALGKPFVLVMPEMPWPHVKHVVQRKGHPGLRMLHAALNEVPSLLLLQLPKQRLMPALLVCFQRRLLLGLHLPLG